MTATINASAGGVVLTSDTSGTLAIQSGGVTKLAVSSTGPSLTWPDSAVAQTRSGWERIAADVNPSSAASLEFTSIPSTVNAVQLNFSLMPATNAVTLYLRLSQSGVFLSGASDYLAAYGELNSSGGVGVAASNTTYFRLSGNGVSTNAIYGGISGRILLPNIQSAQRTHILADWSVVDSSNLYYQKGFSYGAAGFTGAIDGVRLLFSSGNIASGRVSILGLRG